MNSLKYLSIKKIKKSFKNNEVLKGIDIEIAKGELICFLGPSGCGKTTLLRIIAGLEEQSQGEIELDGKDITELEPAKRNIGIVFQNYALFPNLTIYENVEYGLVNKKVSKKEREKKVDEILSLVGLSDHKNKYPSELSGGQQQRVALARAIVLKPDILLLDEPLSALDAKVRENLRGEIKKIQRSLNITTIMVTHDQEEALTMGDKIVVFNSGEVMQIGTPEEIYYNPKNDFTADFIGKINHIGKLNGQLSYMRPECVDVSKNFKLGYKKGLVKEVEFRGNVYRMIVDVGGVNSDIYVDVSWKEKTELDIKAGEYLYLKLDLALGACEYA